MEMQLSAAAARSPEEGERGDQATAETGSAAERWKD